jgi:hypothetical protein
MNRSAIALSLVIALAIPLGVSAEEHKALFVLIVGVNKSIDDDLPPLRYADDDAARYFDLFRSLGARTYLLTRPDENTSRLHPQAAAETREPLQRSLRETVLQLASDVEKAKNRRVETAFYFVYAGHGNARNGRGYITLEDTRLTGRQLTKEIIEKVGASETHLIVDACHSFFLAYSRGPGGTRRIVRGFSRLNDFSVDKNVGLLLSTSSSRESHEWEAFQAGVFSHEVRSGLYGAADADGDGRVSYKEIAAFVERANEAIPNERFRPRVYARPPDGRATLLDINPALHRRLEVNGPEHGHYFLEDTRGVRLLDFHNAPEQPLRILRPSAGLLYLRRIKDRKEYPLPSAPEVVSLADLTPRARRSEVRGAAHHAFELLFSLPFGTKEVKRYKLPGPESIIEIAAQEPEQPSRWREYAGWGSLGLAGAAAVTGLVMTIWAADIRNSNDPNQDHRHLIDLNKKIDDLNTAAVALYCASSVAIVTGLFLLLWPDDPPEASVSIQPGGAVFTMGIRF